MKKLNIDINAHIANVTCDVFANGDDSILSISFDNISDKDITAVEFNAIGCNSFGDVIPVNGEDSFLVIVQDIKISKNSHVSGLKATVPNSKIKKVKLEERRIAYSDDTVLTYLGKDVREFEVTEFTDNMDDKSIRAIKACYGKNLSVYAEEFNCGWICSCQRLNSLKSQKCTCCGNSKKDVFNFNNQEAVGQILKEYQKIADNLKRRRKKKLKIAILASICTFVLVTLVVLGGLFILSRNATFASEAEMRDELQGVYCSDEIDKESISIRGNNLYLFNKYYGGEDFSIEWDPEEGVVHAHKDIVVKKNGDLRVDGKVYKKSDASADGDLKITIENAHHNYANSICSGTVSNIGNKTYTNVALKATFKDAEGNIINSNWELIDTDSAQLNPNDSTTFRISVSKDSNIKSCSVSLLYSE